MRWLCCLWAGRRAAAQEPSKDTKPATTRRPPKPKPAEANPPKEETFLTDHTIHIGGQAIAYKATASTTLLKDDKGEPTALIYSTAYTRERREGFQPASHRVRLQRRPGLFLDLAAHGSVRPAARRQCQCRDSRRPLLTSSRTTRIRLLDKADLVFIDPVGTGFSHAVGKAQNKDFWGVDQDVKMFAQFINIYFNRNNRWNSPKFLIGESYGTFRSVALGNYLQSHDGMYINGIVLISSVLNLGTISFDPGDDMPYILYLPSYAAAAAYQKVLPEPPSDLPAFLAEARKFAATEYADALMKGANITAAEKVDIAKKLSHFTGLSEDYLLKADLRVNLPQFNVELERSRGLTTGRYDARYTMPTYDLLTEYAEEDPSYIAVRGAFTAAFNSYTREELKVTQERSYEVLNGEVGQQLGLETSWPGMRRIFSRLGERRRRSDPGADDQSAPARASRKRILRYGHAVFRHRIHHGPSVPAGKSAQQHPAGILRRGPHDVPARRRFDQAEVQHRGIH